MHQPAFEIACEEHDGTRVVAYSGRLSLPDGDALLTGTRARIADTSAPVTLDLSGVESVDGASASLLWALRREHERRGGTLAFVGANESVATMLDLCTPTEDTPGNRHHARRDFVTEIGRATAERLDVARRVLAFGGELAAGIVTAVRRPRSVYWRELPHLMERAGADSIPIVTLINFLVGLIMGYQAAIQLARFGANVFIADLVGLSVVRELGPLMTAIIVAGRSGAAYAAELGTMQVREEIDALNTLCLRPTRFLVLPRVVALAVVVPLLTLFADLVGVSGGLVVAVAQLDLTMTGYLNELHEAVDLWDVFGGVIKSVVFAVTIALIACQRGLSTRGGADAVGASTTSAVVIILFALVALDAMFAVLFDLLGI